MHRSTFPAVKLDDGVGPQRRRYGACRVRRRPSNRIRHVYSSRTPDAYRFICRLVCPWNGLPVITLPGRSDLRNSCESSGALSQSLPPCENPNTRSERRRTAPAPRAEPVRLQGSNPPLSRNLQGVGRQLRLSESPREINTEDPCATIARLKKPCLPAR